MTREEKIYEFMRSDGYVPLMEKELMTVLDVPETDRAELEEILLRLIDEGKIMKSRRGRYVATKGMGLLNGIYQGSDRGFGFVTAEGEDKDIFIASSNTGGAMNGDSVVLKLIAKEAEGKRAEGKITKVTKRANRTLLCTLKRRFGKCVAIADNKRIWQYIHINPAHTMGAENAQKVMVEITKYPEESKDAEGRVVEVLGYPDDPETMKLSVMRSFGLEEEFSDKVMEEVKAVPKTVTAEAAAERRDLRSELIITIDGEDAKDLDDAVSVKMLENGNYLLGVHIADVTHYVKENSEILKEATERGTSVYLAGGVIPMLPRELSNGICSLNENIDRLTLSIDMEITPKGEIISHDIYKAVIKTRHRMNYTDVTRLLKGNKKLREQYEDITEMLKNMKALAELLRKRRKKEGSIDFEFPEIKLIFDDAGRVIDLYPYEYTISNIIIEEFMLAANRTVAERFFWQELPFVYRVHEPPSEDKITELMRVLSVFNLKIKGKAENIHPRELQKILEEIKGQPYEQVVSTIILRSMMKADYRTENKGHFGLSAKYYCHFTSPIRRLADLTIHRIIKSAIEGEDCGRYEKMAETAAQKASDREIIAEEAERLSRKLKIAEYVADFVGMECEGIISGITQSAFFVTLPNGVEGRISLSDLQDDYYVLIPTSYSLRGERTGKTYNMGDSVNIIIAAADRVTGDITFLIDND